jgi:3-phenylpropionate/cinnamic acid dioxygenase small subunit
VPDIRDKLRIRERVCDFYAHETALLDDRRYREWLELLDDDIVYVMPMSERREGPPSEADEQLPAFQLFNEDKITLTMRVERFDTGLALVESPPSLTQRLVTDILIGAVDEDSIEVRSSFLVYQIRDETNAASFVGRRLDRLRVHEDTFRVARREITLAHLVLPRAAALFF